MNAGWTSLSRTLAEEVAEELTEGVAADRSSGGFRDLDDHRAHARQLIADGLGREQLRRVRAGEEGLSADDESAITRDVLSRLFGLGGLQRYLDDPRVCDIHVQGHDVVWLRHIDGSRHRGDPVADSDDELVDLLRTAAARLGRTERRFDAANPELNLQLPDGSRLFAVMEVAPRPCVAIRKHRFELAFLTDLQERGTLDRPLLEFLRAAVVARRSIVIAGDIGSGKTTLMRALINEIPADERLVTIEDALELGIDRFEDLHPDVVPLETREANIEGHGAVTLEQLVRMGLRMDPDRVFVGEVRGSEVLPMLLAMSQGQDGSMCTVHANHARGVFRRLQMYGVLPPHRLSPADTALLIANAVDLVVHLGQERDRHGQLHRYVTSVLEVTDVEASEVVANEVFRPGADGRATPTGAIGRVTLAALERAGFTRELLSSNGQVSSWS